LSVGLLFSIIGFCLLAFTTGGELPLSVIRWVVPFFGLFIVGVGIFLPSIQRRQIPDEIIFDNSNGRVQVNQQASGIKTAYIYYDEIEDLVLKVKTHSSTSSGTMTGSKSFHTYHIYIAKHDGGQWEIAQFNNENDAKLDLDKLRLIVKLSNTPVRVPVSLEASSKYVVKDNADRFEFSWRNRLGIGPFALLAFVLFFLTIAYAIVGTGFVFEDLFGIIVGGFIGVVFLIVVGDNIRKMIKNARTQYVVAITKDALVYGELDNAGLVKDAVNVQHQNIHAISFTFDTEKNFRKIFIYTRDQFEKQRTMTLRLSINSVKEMYTFYRGLLSLEIQSLTAVEALVIESVLQEQIRSRGGNRVV